MSCSHIKTQLKSLVLVSLILFPVVALAQDHATHNQSNNISNIAIADAHEQNNDEHQQQDHSAHATAEASEVAQDHSQHMHEEEMPASDHQMHDEMNHETMSHEMMEMQDQGVLRDPHAYSNGYVLTSGPFVLQTDSMIGLADETIFTGLWVDRFEYVESHDTDATEFEGHAWLGDSYNRWLLRSEIEVVNDSLETAEVDLLHSRAISPFWDVRFGVRREFGDNDDRNWASIGFGGLAPYWFEVDASLFLGENGNSLLDIEAEYDLLLNQRLVLQPRIDIHAYGKTDKEMGHGAGLSTVKAGFRVRYEFDRQLAPYFGVERVLKYGKTADLLTLEKDREDTHWIIGFKFWF
ncbi:MAG: copper resistance protein B [Gammaproteobacteria bacterium]|nr:copper resistance protein B [Gammaproteobacteria bacterium]